MDDTTQIASSIVSVRIEDHIKKKLERAADSLGLGLSTFIRMAAIKEAEVVNAEKSR